VSHQRHLEAAFRVGGLHPLYLVKTWVYMGLYHILGFSLTYKRFNRQYLSFKSCYRSTAV